MKKAFHRARRLVQSPEFLVKFHGWSVVAWLVASVPICIFLADSIPFVVFISVYAIVISHWEGWQTAVQMLFGKKNRKDPPL